MNDIDKEFLRMEQELDLFEVIVSGDIYIWERMRKKVRKKILESKNIRGQAHTEPVSTRDTIQKAWQLGKNLFYKNPFLTSEADILFSGHRRRKKLEDGLWWDIYTDPIIEHLEMDYLLVESPYLASHKTPAKTEDIRYLDMITYLDGVRDTLGLYQPLGDADSAFFEKIEQEIKQRFDVTINITSIGERKILERNTSLPLYRTLLKQIDPSIVVLVVSYSSETFIEACQEQDIPVVELQHGVIYESHFGYHYPENRPKRHFPDYLLTWGQFWNSGAEYPIPDDRVISVGYPYLEQRREKFAREHSKDQILFISQGTIGEQLSQFAMEVHNHPGIHSDIVYKLHPGEYDRWQEEYPWLVDADFEVIDNSEPSLYKLFAESSVQIGVYSTAVYEGLAFDLETYVYDCSGSDILDPLLEERSAKLISTVEELASSLGTNDTSFDSDYYFLPNATERMCEILNQLADEGTSYRA